MNTHIEQIRKQARDKNTALEVLTKLANHQDKLTRQYVAANPTTPLNILEKLSKEFPEEVFTNPIIDIAIANKSPKIPINFLIERERYLGSKTVFSLDDSCEDAEVWEQFIELTINEQRKQAQDETTAPKILEELAKKQDKQIRQYVASNPNTPVECLEKLGAEFPEEIVNNPVFELIRLENLESRFIQLSEARSQTTSSAKLFKLANSPSRKVGEAIAGNCNTTYQTLAKLLTNKYEKKQSPLFYHNLIHHPNSSTEIIDGVFRKCRYSSVKESALKCAKTSATTLKAIARDRYTVGRSQNYELLVKHPHVSPEIINIAKININSKDVTSEVIKEFACRSDYVAKLAFQHQNMSAEILAELSLSDLEAVKISVGEHPKTTIATLKYLTKDENQSVREAIAQRKHLCAEIAAILANDPSESVRVLIAEIKHLTPETILRLAKDPDEAVRCLLLKHNRNLIHRSHETLLELARDESKFVRASVAFYQQLSAKIIEILAFDPSMTVRHALVCDRNYYRQIAKSHLPFDVLWKMLEQSQANSDLESSPLLTKTSNVFNQEVSIRGHEPLSEGVINFYLKLAIAKHPDTPLDFLHTLTTEENDRIRAAAAKNPKLPATTLDKLMDDESRKVRKAVTYNPSVSSDTLRRGAKVYYARSARRGHKNQSDIAFKVLRKRQKAAIFGMAIALNYRKSLNTTSLINTYKILNRVSIRLLCNLTYKISL